MVLSALKTTMGSESDSEVETESSSGRDFKASSLRFGLRYERLVRLSFDDILIYLFYHSPSGSMVDRSMFSHQLEI